MKKVDSLADYNYITYPENTDTPFVLADTLGDDVITGRGGPDRITVSSGNDIINGGGGVDTLIFETASTDVSFYRTFDKVHPAVESKIVSNNGTVQFASIERLQFTDKWFALDTDSLTSGAGMVARAIIVGMGVENLFINLNIGLSLIFNQFFSFIGENQFPTELAHLFNQISFPEDMSDAEFVSKVVQNVTGVKPETYSLDGYVDIVKAQGRVKFLELASEHVLTTNALNSQIEILGLPLEPGLL